MNDQHFFCNSLYILCNEGLHSKKRLRNHVWFPQAFFIVSIYISFYQASSQMFFFVVSSSP